MSSRKKSVPVYVLFYVVLESIGTSFQGTPENMVFVFLRGSFQNFPRATPSILYGSPLPGLPHRDHPPKMVWEPSPKKNRVTELCNTII